jgi:hypothetical protein
MRPSIDAWNRSDVHGPHVQGRRHRHPIRRVYASVAAAAAATAAAAVATAATAAVAAAAAATAADVTGFPGR